MKKFVLDLTVSAVERLNGRHVLIKLTDDKPLPDMRPGQFAEISVKGAEGVFLRRPISINFVDRSANEVWFLVQERGNGTNKLGQTRVGDVLNVVLPLGNGFTMPGEGADVLLVGGGVGTAPLLDFGRALSERGVRPAFLLGARTKGDLLQLEQFGQYGDVFVTTEDGSMGEKGFVTNHSVLSERRFSQVSVCGPKPMMVAVARWAKKEGVFCEVSLENMMACGLGACLCCVEKTVEGNLCVCKDGPVFNINKLLWQI